MKLKPTLLSLLIIIAVTVSSCKEDDTPFRDSLSNTTWAGDIDVTDDIVIKFGENAKMTLFNGGLNAPASEQFAGTYTYTNNTVLFTISDPTDPADKFSFGGTLVGNEISGSYGEGANTSGGGIFSITKQ